ncbi:hypothetical protein SRHO_G00173450 [Serrasalmus rhombeus]
MLTLSRVLDVGGPMEPLAQSFNSHGLDHRASSLRKQQKLMGASLILLVQLSTLIFSSPSLQLFSDSTWLYLSRLHLGSGPATELCNFFLALHGSISSWLQLKFTSCSAVSALQLLTPSRIGSHTTLLCSLFLSRLCSILDQLCNLFRIPLGSISDQLL